MIVSSFLSHKPCVCRYQSRMRDYGLLSVLDFLLFLHQFSKTKGHGYGRGSGPPRPRGMLPPRGLVQYPTLPGMNLLMEPCRITPPNSQKYDELFFFSIGCVYMCECRIETADFGDRSSMIEATSLKSAFSRCIPLKSTSTLPSNLVLWFASWLSESC